MWTRYRTGGQVVARVSPPARPIALAIEESRGWGHPRYNFCVAHPRDGASFGICDFGFSMETIRNPKSVVLLLTCHRPWDRFIGSSGHRTIEKPLAQLQTLHPSYFTLHPFLAFLL